MCEFSDFSTFLPILIFLKKNIIIIILVGTEWHLVVPSYISLMINNVEYLVMCLLITNTSFLENTYSSPLLIF